MLDSIEKIIYCCIEDEPVTFPKEYLKDFAFFIHTTQKKCPCPKPSWKPSKEQMKALVNCTLGEDYDVHALVRLFGELKNL